MQTEKIRRIWQQHGPIEYEFAVGNNTAYPTGQQRQKLKNGTFLYFTSMDDSRAIELLHYDEEAENETIELSLAGLMEVK